LSKFATPLRLHNSYIQYSTFSFPRLFGNILSLRVRAYLAALTYPFLIRTPSIFSNSLPPQTIRLHFPGGGGDWAGVGGLGRGVRPRHTIPGFGGGWADQTDPCLHISTPRPVFPTPPPSGASWFVPFSLVVCLCVRALSAEADAVVICRVEIFHGLFSA